MRDILRRVTSPVATLIAGFAALLVLPALMAFDPTGGSGGDGDGGGDGSGGSGSGDGSGSGAGDGEGGAGDGSAADGAPGSGDGDASKTVSMTQADLDALIDKRLGRAKTQWEKDAETAAARAKMDDAQRAQAEKEEADQRAAAAVTTANTRIVNAEAKVVAATSGVPKEQLAYVLRLADLSDVDVDDDGNADTKAIQTAIDKVLADVPALKGTPAPGTSGAEHSGGGGDKPKTLKGALAEFVGAPT